MMKPVSQVGIAFLLLTFGRFFGYVLQVVLARIAGPDVYGEYSLALSIVTLFSEFVSLGYINSIICFVPALSSTNKFSDLRGYLHKVLRVTNVSGWTLAAVCMALLILLPVKFHSLSACLFSLTVPLAAYLEYNYQLSRCIHKAAIASLPISLIRPIANVLLIVGFYLTIKRFRLWTLALCLVIAHLISLIAFRWISPSKRKLFGRHKITFGNSKRWRRVSMSMLFVAGFQTILAQSDLTMTGLFVSPTEAGFYSIGTKIAALAGSVFMAVNQVYVPRISSTFVEGDKGKLQRLLTKASLVTFLPTVFVSAVIYLGDGIVLRLFGPEYYAARNVLEILIIGQLAIAIFGPVGYVLNLTGKHKVCMRIYAVTAIFNIIGCYFAAKYVGNIEAIAWVTTGSFALGNLWMHIAVAKQLQVWPSVLSTLRIHPLRQS